MNKAILMGYVGADPKIRYVETRPVASFSMATTERGRRMPDGSQLPDRTEWHNIVMWDANAEFAEKYIRKGSRLLIEGKIRTRFGRIATPSSTPSPRYTSTASTCSNETVRPRQHCRDLAYTHIGA